MICFLAQETANRFYEVKPSSATILKLPEDDLLLPQPGWSPELRIVPDFPKGLIVWSDGTVEHRQQC